MTFFTSLLETLGIGIGTFLTFVFIAGIGLIVIINFDFFIALFRAISDWIVSQLAKIPLFANGVYSSMIRRTKNAIKDTRDLQSQLEGQKQELLSDHSKNEDEYKKATKRASYLKREGNMTEALVYAKRAVKLKEENKKIMEIDIPNLIAASNAASTKIASLQESVENLKHERKSVNKTRKTSIVLEKANRALMGDNTEADEQILEGYRDSVNSRRIKAQGTEAVLASLPREKVKSLDDKILSKDAERFLDTL